MLLIAAYCATYNPPSSDSRIFVSFLSIPSLSSVVPKGFSSKFATFQMKFRVMQKQKVYQRLRSEGNLLLQRRSPGISIFSGFTSYICLYYEVSI